MVSIYGNTLFAIWCMSTVDEVSLDASVICFGKD